MPRKIARLCFTLLRKEISFEHYFRSGESAIGKKIIKFSCQELPSSSSAAITSPKS